MGHESDFLKKIPNEHNDLLVLFTLRKASKTQLESDLLKSQELLEKYHTNQLKLLGKLLSLEVQALAWRNEFLAMGSNEEIVHTHILAISSSLDFLESHVSLFGCFGTAWILEFILEFNRYPGTGEIITRRLAILRRRRPVFSPDQVFDLLISFGQRLSECILLFKVPDVLHWCEEDKTLEVNYVKERFGLFLKEHCALYDQDSDTWSDDQEAVLLIVSKKI